MVSSDQGSDSVHQPVIYSRDQHSISRQQIDPDALKILYRLLRHGFKAYLVGGGVRDLLLGKKPKDFDIGTDATPKRIKDIFRNSRIIGRRFKLVHIFFTGNKIIEVSTFRDCTDPPELPEGVQDPESSRELLQKRDNRYGTEETDAVRRDITINGLFYDISSFSVIDYVGGVADLQAGIVKVIGDPDVRFREDPVRMLRVVRHAIRSNFVIDEACWLSLLKNRSLIGEVTPVRVYDELKKDLTSGYSLEILRLLHEASLLELLIPELMQPGSAFLRDASDFCLAVQRADALILKGEPVSATAILAILTLFMGDHDFTFETVRTRFETSDELREHVFQSFSDLAVPRKEKERIEKLLTELLHLLNTPSDKRKLGSSGRFASLQDIYTLWKVIDPEDAERTLPDLEQQTTPRKHRDDQGPKRRGRRRGGRRQPERKPTRRFM